MKLLDYLKDNGIRCSFLAARMGVSPNYMFAIAAGKREPSLALACKIEAETKGKVRPKDLVIEGAEYKAKRNKTIAEKVDNAMAQDSILNS